MARVFIEPIGVTVEIADQATLLDAVTSAAVDLRTDCHGRGTCGKCLVRLGTGGFSEPTEVEHQKVAREKLMDGWRLACQTRPLSARVSIEVRQAQGRRRIPTASHLRGGAVRPLVRQETVGFAPATLADPRADAERVASALGVRELRLGAIRRLPDVLRAGDFRALVTRYGREVIDVEGADAEPRAFGAGVDVGTSKIIAYLFDLRDGRAVDQEAVENPQMRYGEDVVTRMTQAVHHDRLGELTAAVREGINGLLATLCARQEIEARHIYDMVVVGNTVMHHLVLGVSPLGMSAAPFAPALSAPLTVRAAELGLDMNPEGGVHLPPPIAGFVGSDCLAVIAATRLAGKRRPALAVDIGTNTEVVVAAGGRIVVTSAASGPAFEGYQMTCGMKAVEGAIDRVRLSADGEPQRVETVGGREPLGLCGSGVVDVLAGLSAAGVVDAGGRLQPHPRVRQSAAGDGLEYVLTEGAGGDIVVTQHDVRNLQLAKGAIATAWTLLLEDAGLDPGDLRHVYVAGAFGNYLDRDHALAIGLLPPVPRERVEFVGNAAGVGAQMALVDGRARRRMATLRRRLTFLDLATNSDFHEVFTGKLTFV
jgi:uncharacterized 2Fe-2S/4Fe-4S cluster protein (DUF4445 family)